MRPEEGKGRREWITETTATNGLCFSYGSYGDISEESMFKDMDKLIYGGIVMFVYMQLVLSKFSWTEFRVR